MTGLLRATPACVNVMSLLVASVLAGCGGSTNQLEPIDLALVLPSNFETTGSAEVGRTDTFVEFDAVRERDSVAITQPVNVLITPEGFTEAGDLRDSQGNRIFTERAVALLGNGPDPDGDGVPGPTPESVPDILDPLAPYPAPAGWSARATLAYVPNQTTIPGRAGTNQFGVYVASILAFQGRLQFVIRDQLNQGFARTHDISHQLTGTQPVTVAINGFAASEAEPIVITICNQFNAALHIGLTSGTTSTVEVPTVQSQPDSILNASTAYVAEAYQFNSSGTVLRLSTNPSNPALLSVPLLSTTEPSGSVTLDLTNVTAPANRFTCAGDNVDDLNAVLTGFFG